MGKKILVAQIGKLPSQKANKLKYGYFFDSEDDNKNKYINGKYIEACYSFPAYLKGVGSEEFTDLLLIGTLGSTWEAFLEHESENILHSSIAELRDKFKAELEQNHKADTTREELDKKVRVICGELERELKRDCKVNTKTVIIENGVTVTEIDRNFNKIKEQLEYMIKSEKINNDCNKEISIYLDVSNSFRSVPMLVFAATNYLSVLHNNYKFNLDVYCSVWESKVKEVIPMVNITTVSVINQWSMAINEFYDSGSVVKLTQLIKDGKDEWFAGNVPEAENKRKCPQKNEIIKALEEFSFAVNSNNLNAFINAVKTIISIRLNENNMPVYIYDFMSHLVKDFEKRFAVVNEIRCYGSLTLAIARWYADQSRFGDAVVALQEGIVTYVIENYEGAVKDLLKKRTGIADTEADALEVKQLLVNDECRSLVHSLIFTYDEEYEDFEEYLKEKSEKEETLDAWKRYLERYNYICKNLRNPAMKLQYLSTGADIVSTEVLDNGEYDMKKAEEYINYCIDAMIENDKAIKGDYIQCKLEYLNEIEFNDFFISYRRRYNTNNDNEKDNDGYIRARGIADALEEREGPKGKYKVWMDDELEKETGGKFTPKIRKAIRNSRYFIVLLGNNAFNRPLYKNPEEMKPVLQPFYEEIITAYRHFKEDSENRIIVVTFDNYHSIPEDERKKVELLNKKAQVIEWHSEAGGYYDTLMGLVITNMQVHPAQGGKIQELVERLLATRSLKQEREKD